MTKKTFIALLSFLALVLLFCVAVPSVAPAAKSGSAVSDDSFGQEMSALNARHNEERRQLMERQKAERNALRQRYDKGMDPDDSDDWTKDKSGDQGQDKDKGKEKSKGKDKDEYSDSYKKGGDKGKKGNSGKQ